MSFFTPDPPEEISTGDYVFWDRSTHPEEVWRVLAPNRQIQMSAAIQFVVGPLLRAPEWQDRSVLKDSLTKIQPLELLALMARTPNEWLHSSCFGEVEEE